jgi:hypothetical protein
MEYHAPDSTCQLCGQDFARKGMARHIGLCLKKELEKRPVNRSETLIHLHISATYQSDYFLHLLVSSRITLNELDRYLRSIWLECCGHMSVFFIKKNREELSMSSRIDDLFSHTSELHYEYDFGSTTDLSIKLLNKYSGTSGLAGKINLLARNAMPVVPCDDCGESPTVQICSECQWDGGGWLCDACAEEHDCDEEMLLPVVNSPRVGVCAYQGNYDNEGPAAKIFTGAAGSQKTSQQKQGLVLASNRNQKNAKPPAAESDSKQERMSALKQSIRFFSKAHLNQELEGYAIKLVDTMHDNEYIDLTRGKVEIWASAVIYVIARLNFLFDSLNPCHISADTICDFFKTKKSTVSAKATQIEDDCDLSMGEEGFCNQEIRDTLTLYETPEGFVFPKSMLPQIEGLLANGTPDKIGGEIIKLMFNDLDKLLPKEKIEHLKSACNSILQGLIQNDRSVSKSKQIADTPKTKHEEEKLNQLRLKLVEQQQKQLENEQNIIDSGQFTIFDP